LVTFIISCPCNSPQNYYLSKKAAKDQFIPLSLLFPAFPSYLNLQGKEKEIMKIKRTIPMDKLGIQITTHRGFERVNFPHPANYT
jgi:hypothetical protein